MYGTIWALLPLIIAIAFALITKEVYSSLFLGIVVGGLLVANFSPVGAASADAEEVSTNPRSRVIDLLLPVAVLIVCCVLGMLYVGGFFDGVPFAQAFAATGASVGLPWGSMIALLFTFFSFFCLRLLRFKQTMGCITKGFIAMARLRRATHRKGRLYTPCRQILS